MTVIQSGQDRFAGHTIFGAFLTLSTDVTALITIISELRLNPFFCLEKSGLQPAHPCSNARNIHLSPEGVKLFLTESYEKREMSPTAVFAVLDLNMLIFMKISCILYRCGTIESGNIGV